MENQSQECFNTCSTAERRMSCSPQDTYTVIQQMPPLTLTRNTFSLHLISFGRTCQFLTLNAGIMDSYSASVSFL